ncbi:MAG: hypothetical protein ACOC9P_02740 [bacterium]
MLPTTAQRVPRHTDERINEQIRQRTEIRIAYYAQHRDQIDDRLGELEQEWDIERTLEANAATLAFSGTVLGVLGSRRWLILPAVVTGFLLQHALQGWCPPLPVFRRMGVRTRREIDTERHALKVLRGDYHDVPEGDHDAAEILERVRR